MEGNYGVSFGKQQVGKVQLRRQGLYYQIVCRCRLTGDVVCRLVVSCGEKQEKLGVLVPMDGGFGLTTTIAAKRLGDGVPEFYLAPKHEINHGNFVPIYPEEPFAYITRIKNSFLARKDGQVGLIIKDM